MPVTPPIDFTNLSAKFEEGEHADPTENMTEEQKKEWWMHHEKNKDQFKQAAEDLRPLAGGQERTLNLLRLWRAAGDPAAFEARARTAMYSRAAIAFCIDHLAAEESDNEGKYEEGKPADPTENMTPEQKKDWESNTDKYQDKFTGKEAAGGLYGYPKTTQRDVEASIRRIERQATQIATAAWGRDERVARFLEAHARRASSMPARILSAALKNASPDPKKASEVTAGAAEYGLYGHQTRTARLGLAACTELREFVGRTAYDLHSRRTAAHQHITGFLRDHTKESKCRFARLLLDSYPDAPSEASKTASIPNSVEGWLRWEG